MVTGTFVHPPIVGEQSNTTHDDCRHCQSCWHIHWYLFGLHCCMSRVWPVTIRLIWSCQKRCHFQKGSYVNQECQPRMSTKNVTGRPVCMLFIFIQCITYFFSPSQIFLKFEFLFLEDSQDTSVWKHCGVWNYCAVCLFNSLYT